MKNLFENFNRKVTETEVNSAIEKIKLEAQKQYNEENLKLAFSLIDLTFLNATDNKAGIQNVINKVNGFSEKYPEMPNVAAICVYPNYVEQICKGVENKQIGLASVVGGFPASQTFLEVKTHEARLAVQAGATDADMVISIGEFLNEEYQHVFHEVHKMKRAIGDDKILKVILETGVLTDYYKIYKSSILAMEAGADFVKTSTGKEKVGATPESVYVMALAVKDFYEKTGKKIGIKPAGGVSNGADAVMYMNIIRNTVGDQWLTPKLFRFGTSSLANKLLNEIYKNDDKYFSSNSNY